MTADAVRHGIARREATPTTAAVAAGTVLAALGIGVLSYLIGSGSLLLVWPAMPAGLNELITFFATTSMAKVLVFALIVVFLQIRPAGLFPQKGRMVEA